MKTKKILSLILALCMVMSVISVGILSASAAEIENDANVSADDTEIDVTVTWKPTIKSVYVGDDDLNAVSGLLKTYYDQDTYNLVPVQVVATQTVSGTNYACLCSCAWTEEYALRMYDLAKYVDKTWLKYNMCWYDILTVFVDNEGNAKLLSSKKINVNDIKTVENAPERGAGAWNIVAKASEDDFDYYDFEPAVIEALDGNVGLKFDIIAELGTIEDNSVTKYRCLCYGTTSAANPTTNIYVVDLLVEDDKAEITDIACFDLEAYVTTKTVDPTEPNDGSGSTNETQTATEAPNNNQTATEASDGKGTNTTSQANSSNGVKSGSSGGTTSVTSTGSSSGSASSSTSPKTGQSETVAFIMLGVLLLSAGVIFFVRKRERT